ncbi:MAG: DUF4089 domain-containing protein [Leptolyngbyaceae cyanobacterium SM2_5_2]|nr:DUF4089 domain-containing protein [Leptolyngbyaceae cyanobacterium SM2_5_2]
MWLLLPPFDATTYVCQTAALLGLVIPPEIEAGVVANFEHIQAIAQPLMALNLPDSLESAATFQP